MVKVKEKLGRAWAAAAALVLLFTGAAAGPVFPEETVGQQLLKRYLENADSFLIQQGEPGINSLFEAYRTFEIFGITDLPDAEARIYHLGGLVYGDIPGRRADGHGIVLTVFHHDPFQDCLAADPRIYHIDPSILNCTVFKKTQRD